MNCPIDTPETAELLLEYCDGRLSPEATADLDRHIPACAGCKAFVASHREVWTALDSFESVPVSEDFDRRLYARIAEEGVQPWYRRWFSTGLTWRPALSLGAACAAVGAALFFNAPTTAPTPQPPAYVENTKAESVEPEQVERALEDMEMLNQLSPSATQDL